MTIAHPSALQSRHVVLGRGDALRVAPATLTLANGRITGVYEGDAPPGITPLDLGDKLVAPAFINAHTHLSLAILRGLGGSNVMAGNVVEDLYFRVEQHLQADDVRAFARINALEALVAGTAVVFDHYYYGLSVAEALVDVGLAGVVAPTLQDRSGPGVPWLASALDDTRAIASSARLAAHGVFAALGPHASDTVSDALFDQVATLAEAHALPVHLHLAQSHEELLRSLDEHGVPPLTRLARLGVLDAAPSTLAVHAQLVTDAERRAAVGHRLVLGHTPLSQAQYWFPTDAERWLADGVPVALGTDCGSSADGMDVQRELVLLGHGAAFAHARGSAMSALRAAVTQADQRAAAIAVKAERESSLAARSPFATPASLLASVWSVPGDLHPAMPCGELASGKLAHVAVWDMRHPCFWPAHDPLRALAYSAAAPGLFGLLVNGRWAGTPGAHAASLADHPDLPAWREEADGRLAALRRRAGV